MDLSAISIAEDGGEDIVGELKSHKAHMAHMAAFAKNGGKKSRRESSISAMIQFDRVMSSYNRTFSTGEQEKGALYAWGMGSKELGLEDQTVINRPQILHVLTKLSVTMVACGKAHTLALVAGGNVFAWGANQWGQLGLGDKQPKSTPFSLKYRSSPLLAKELTYVAASLRTSAVITEEGELYVWGYAKDGAIGAGPVGSDSETTPVRVYSQAMEKNEHKIKQVALGARHTLAVTESGVLYSWGVGITGALGHSEQKNYNRPKMLDQFHEFFDSVAAGDDFSAAIGFDSNVYTWGKNDVGQCGQKPVDEMEQELLVTPAPVIKLWRKGITHVVCGRNHMVAHDVDSGTVYSTIVMADNKDATFARLLPNRIHVTGIDVSWHDTTIGLTRDGRECTWNASNLELVSEKRKVVGSLCDNFACGERMMFAIGSWRGLTPGDPHQDLKNCDKEWSDTEINAMAAKMENESVPEQASADESAAEERARERRQRKKAKLKEANDKAQRSLASK
jgi:hypothetical protein